MFINRSLRQKALSAAKTAGQLTLMVGMGGTVIAVAGSVLIADAAYHRARKAIKRRLAERRHIASVRRVIG